MEAMFAGKPVVTSAIANEGIGAEHGKEIYIAEQVDEYLSCVEEAIETPERISKQAREFIIRNFSEDGIIDSYVELLDSA
jgi:glycosyltransferase involved in cell wall biosynthesis